MQDQLVYQPTQIINLGFADGRITVQDIDNEVFQDYTPSRTAAALVVYVRAINLKQGDQIRMSLTNDKGEIITKTYNPMKRNRATQMYFSGKKAPRGGWAAGNYTVKAEVLRGGDVFEVETLTKIAQ